MDVELRHLRAFVAVAQNLSFTRAAERMLITQPALTRTVKQLEAALEVGLLDRDSRHVSLTPAGAAFLERAQQVLLAMDQALASTREQVALRMGFSWLLPDPWAQRTLTRYEQLTGSRVSLIRVDDPLSGVVQGHIDVAVVRGPVDGGSPARVVHLFDEVRVAVCSVDSELAAAERVSWAEVGRASCRERVSTIV